MVQRDERVGLAATQAGLKLDDGTARLAGQTTKNLSDRGLETLSGVRVVEEQLGFAIDFDALAAGHLAKAGGVLVESHFAAEDVFARLADVLYGWKLHAHCRLRNLGCGKSSSRMPKTNH